MSEKPTRTSGTCDECGAVMQNKGVYSKCPRCLKEEISDTPRLTNKNGSPPQPR